MKKLAPLKQQSKRLMKKLAQLKQQSKRLKYCSSRVPLLENSTRTHSEENPIPSDQNKLQWALAMKYIL
jgi:division protein CdvB (Snf7/Vps24/ESCRT-III family)